MKTIRSFFIFSRSNFLRVLYKFRPACFVKRGASLIELLVVVSIMMLITGGTIKLLLPYTLQVQNLIHSQMSEGNLRELISSLNDTACTQTFSGKKVGQSIDQIKDKKGIPLFDRSADDNFQRNLKIVKINSKPKKSLCSSITASSSGECPSGCSDPVSFPGACRGTSSTSTKGYAEIELYFSRPNSLFETEDKTLDCSSSDQTGCYKQSCLLKLTGMPVPTGARGTAVGNCEVMSCVSQSGSGSEEVSCYKVEDSSGSPSSVTLVGCGSTQNINTNKTTALGFNAGNSGVGSSSTFIGYETGRLSTGGSNTFVGFKAGTLNTIGADNTFIGVNSGFNNTEGEFNTFLGKGSGYSNRTGEENTFLGYQAGVNNTIGGGNTFVGLQTGSAYNKGNENTFLGKGADISQEAGKGNVVIGYEARGRKLFNTVIGYQARGTGRQAVAIGHKASGGIAIGHQARGGIAIGNQARGGIAIGNQASGSLAIGHHAVGGLSIGDYAKSNPNNISIGLYAGNAHSTLCCNTFIGYEAGRATKGALNTFLGSGAGKLTTGGFLGDSTSGYRNTFLGAIAGGGNTTGYNNTFIGHAAGLSYTTGSNNIMIGNEVGFSSQDLIGNNNIIIGSQGFIGPANSSNKFSLGHWLTGDIGTDTFKVNGKQVSYEGHTHPTLPVPKHCHGYSVQTHLGSLTATTTSPTSGMCRSHVILPSSRIYKKNIKPFTNYDKALEDIENTTLFTYEYREDHPKKIRWGVISEELPEHLQIKDKGAPSLPDWVSIYGTFWASIKALHKKLMVFKTTFSTQLKNLKTEIAQNIENLNNRFKGFQNETLKQLKDLNSRLSAVNKELLFEMKKIESFFLKKLDSIQIDIQKKLLSLKAKLTDSQKELTQIRSQLSDTEQQLVQIKSELENTKTELANGKSQLLDTKRQQDQTKLELEATKKKLNHLDEIVKNLLIK